VADPIAFTKGDTDVAARTLWGECRGESLQGQIAVAFVLRNRLAYPKWGTSITEVCQKPYQFSCWNPDSPELSAMTKLFTDDPMYQHLYGVAIQVFGGEILFDPSRGATMYQRVGTGAKWSKNKEICALIGNHEFYALDPVGNYIE
jgi:spore germination cell wall hydrolase CwlJ-like protein